MRNLLFIFLAGITLFGCNTYSEEQKSSLNADAENYAKKNQWKYEVLDGGLILEVLKKGTGTEKIQAGSMVSISYKGTLTNGKKFDVTEPGKPFEANLKGLIGGFQIGLLNQVSGTKLRLVIPPHLGYGDDPLDKIPANSILIFEITIEKVF
ncbi:FKBP-type peptidyl-prolyl cis-trans isomerase [Fluviicola taffensis]|uniref:Peptidyl-prolyl cis-trans isomerase n=1 Tax=Fluviicola taffensis (strain DSM 16823 / NCIMB 13979 / RW262) TaxID=755732 RepID=F2IH46_FLUTR|nr:FKBP-type peptidyl-prolyl cis-trans isomerase [Fluviicola taffensis]AEA45860.1 peptidylprolyl isomerase FKBP-type [Fluviicola taffensis DSM 16823]